MRQGPLVTGLEELSRSCLTYYSNKPVRSESCPQPPSCVDHHERTGGCRSSVLSVRALLVKEKHFRIPRREELEAYTMIGRVEEAIWKRLLVHEIGPLMAHSNPESYRKMTLGSGAPGFPAMQRMEKRVDDIKLTKTIWYKQIKPNTHIQSERHKDVITHDSSCVRKEPHGLCEQNP